MSPQADSPAVGKHAEEEEGVVLVVVVVGVLAVEGEGGGLVGVAGERGGPPDLLLGRFA